MKSVVIFGTGDFAQVACVYLSQDSPHQVAAFTAHRDRIDSPELLGREVVPFEEIEARYPPTDYAMFVAIGYRRVNRARADAYGLCKAKGYELISYISSKATHWGEWTHGDNCFIFENNVIQPFVRMGDDVILWSGNHIGHHAEIGDHSFITSHVVVSGGVKVGPYSFLGVNATIRDRVTLGRSSVIGAGALILADTSEEAVYAASGTEAGRVPSSRLRNF
jgi:sugar O-acyltransferase (sialic acid O-acetyltransferase NeuD family)